MPSAHTAVVTGHDGETATYENVSVEINHASGTLIITTPGARDMTEAVAWYSKPWLVTFE